MEIECEGINEHDSSHVDANDDAPSSTNDRTAAMACLNCIESLCKILL